MIRILENIYLFFVAGGVFAAGLLSSNMNITFATTEKKRHCYTD